MTNSSFPEPTNEYPGEKLLTGIELCLASRFGAISWLKGDASTSASAIENAGEGDASRFATTPSSDDADENTENVVAMAESSSPPDADVAANSIVLNDVFDIENGSLSQPTEANGIWVTKKDEARNKSIEWCGQRSSRKEVIVGSALLALCAVVFCVAVFLPGGPGNNNSSNIQSNLATTNDVPTYYPTYFPTYSPTYFPTNGDAASSIGDKSIPDDVKETPDDVEEIADDVEETPDDIEEIPDDVEEAGEVNWEEFAAQMKAMANAGASGGGGDDGGDRSITDDDQALLPTYMPTYMPTSYSPTYYPTYEPTIYDPKRQTIVTAYNAVNDVNAPNTANAVREVTIALAVAAVATVFFV